MGRIVLVCPDTDRTVETGMSLSPRAFAAYQPKNARSFCPHCQTVHRWTKDRMRLVDDPPPDSKA